MYPFIVYGTLRVGGSRARVWRAHATAERGTLAGFRLRDSGRRYPVVVPATEGSVVVDVLTATTVESYKVLLRRFDEIENVGGGLYVRTFEQALVGHESVEGWLYRPGPALSNKIATMPVIASGDWLG